MADSFFGLDTSLSNLDDEGGGEPSEDEYDALNDETFGEAFDEFDWEMEHEHLAGQLESSRRHKSDIDDTANSQLEASLSQLVLDEIDAPQSRTLGSSVWRHDPQTFPAAPAPASASTLKNVCTVEELERQLRAKQQQTFTNQNFFQPRFPPVILQRPPGLQAPVPLPFAPQQPMNHGLNNQTKLMGPSNQINQFGMIQNHVGQNMSPFMNKQFQNNTMNQSGQNNMMNQSGQTNMMNQSVQNNMMNQLPQNMSMHQMSQNNQLLSQAQMQNINITQSMNHLGQNVTQMGQNMTHMGSNMPQMGQGANQMSQNINQMGQFVQNSTNQMGQLVHNSNQMGQLQNPNQMGQLQNSNQMAQNLNQLAPNMNQFGQGANQMGQNLNQLGQNVNQLSQTVNQMNQNTSQMGQNVRMNQNLNQMGQSSNQMGQNLNQIGQPSVKINQNLNHMGQATGQMVQNTNQMSQSTNQMGQNTNQMGKNTNQMGQNTKHLGHNTNQMAQTTNQMGQTTNQMGQNMNHVGQASNQMGQSGQMMPNGNQFPHMMGQPRMMAPPPGINMPRQNFNQNMSQYNSTFRAQSKPEQQLNQPITMTNQQPLPNAKLNSPNQMSQSPQNKSISAKLNKIDQKVTRSRVYNNSKMTSENLVQLIQNTHPMLQYNSYHNANHHPMLSNRSNVYAGNQFSHPVYQRHNGCFSGRHSANGDDASGSDSDEYAGLMTQREKQWLINIQMLQLNTGTPYIHDFYYTVFLERKASKEKEGVKEAHKANQQNHPFYSGGVKQESHTHRERHNSNRHNSTSEDGGTPRTYVPAQFENSLGKLQCGSVTAPRKIIDLEVVGSEPVPSRMSRASSVASTTHPQEVPREMKRTKQLLLDIEALYLILLRLEELNDPLAISNALILKEREEKQKQLEAAQKEAENEPDETNLFLKNIESVQRRPKQESPKSESIDKRQVVNLSVNQKPVPVKNLLDENKDDLVNKMFAGLLHSDRLPQMLTVRKGRTLVARFVSRVGPSHARLRAMWSRVFRALPAAARRDDGGLAALAPHYKKYIQNTNGWSAVLESCGTLAEALDPARTPHALTTSFTLSCVCALIERAAILVNTPEATSNERQWSKFLKTLARALKHTSLNVARPVQPMQESKLMQHIKQLDSRSTIEILQRGKPAEFADITKMDVSEQLVKHLC